MAAAESPPTRSRCPGSTVASSVCSLSESASGIRSVIVAMSAALRIADMALPSPLICGPILATTPTFATSFFVFVAACAGSY